MPILRRFMILPSGELVKVKPGDEHWDWWVENWKKHVGSDRTWSKQMQRAVEAWDSSEPKGERIRKMERDKVDMETPFVTARRKGFIEGDMVDRELNLRFHRKPSRQRLRDIVYDVITAYGFDSESIHDIFWSTDSGGGGETTYELLFPYESVEEGSFPTTRFFIKPDWSVIKINSPHWVWIQKNLHKVDPDLDAEVDQSTMEPMFRRGWWRGSAYLEQGGLSLEFEKHPLPSKQGVIDAAFAFMEAYNIPASRISKVIVETDIGGKHSERTYKGNELFNETVESLLSENSDNRCAFCFDELGDSPVTVTFPKGKTYQLCQKCGKKQIFKNFSPKEARRFLPLASGESEFLKLAKTRQQPMVEALYLRGFWRSPQGKVFYVRDGMTHGEWMAQNTKAEPTKPALEGNLKAEREALSKGWVRGLLSRSEIHLQFKARPSTQQVTDAAWDAIAEFNPPFKVTIAKVDYGDYDGGLTVPLSFNDPQENTMAAFKQMMEQVLEGQPASEVLNEWGLRYVNGMFANFSKANAERHQSRIAFHKSEAWRDPDPRKKRMHRVSSEMARMDAEHATRLHKLHGGK